MATASTARFGQRATLMLQRADALEYRLCLWVNRLSHVDFCRAIFRAVSRLGDGIIWYSLMLFWPLVYGEAGLNLSLRMAVVGAVGLALYKFLKRHLVRERPYITLQGVVAGIPPLDRYSFPSGHTLHAVSFTILICCAFPSMAWWCVPFATLVAASRVVLGLHYPTDVLAGAGIGATLSILCLTYWPLPMHVSGLS